MHLIFRIDDICRYDPFDEEIFRLFIKYQVPLTIGVIPFSENAGKYNNDSFLLSGIKRDLFEVALHGYEHKVFSKVGRYLYSEFCNRPLHEQVSIIQKGKLKVENQFQINCHTFIPPWNSYDRNTLTALAANNIYNVSARLYKGNPSGNAGIKYLPFTVDMSVLIKEQYAKKIHAATNEIAVILFHAYDFVEKPGPLEMKISKYRLKDLEELLSAVASNGDLHTATIGTFCAMNNLDGKAYCHFLSQYTGIKNLFGGKKISYKLKT